MSRRPGDDPYTRGYERPDGVAFRDQEVRHHGGSYVYPGRGVAEGDWPVASPEQCHDGDGGVWIADGQCLVCPGCGLDCT
jgi:hypothetical protein